MSGSLEINGKNLSSLSAVLKHSSYSRDYITRLAREGKIVASQIGRKWYIDLDSLKKYEESISLEQKVRQQKLSKERRMERLQKQAEIRSPYQKHTSQKKHVHTALASSVLFVGVLVGFLFQQNFITTTDSTKQVANSSLVDGSEQLEKGNVRIEDETVQFSNESVSVTTFSEEGEGILLLPDAATGTTTVNPKDLFSDDVTVVTDEHGQAFIVKRDKTGKELERIPYIVVPVTNNETL